MTDCNDIVCKLRGAYSTFFDRGLAKTASEEIERLRAENAALRADAERYQWLRDYALAVDFTADSDNRVQIWISGFGSQERRSYGKTLDEAVDAARESKP